MGGDKLAKMTRSRKGSKSRKRTETVDPPPVEESQITDKQEPEERYTPYHLVYDKVKSELGSFLSKSLKVESKPALGRYPDGNRRSIDLGEVNLALGQDINGNGNPSIDALNTFGADSAPMNPSATGTAMQRQQSQVGLNQQAQAQTANGSATPQSNGIGPAGAMNGMGGMPMHAGQQMDLNFIYAKVIELSDQLKENREQTQGLVARAEQLAVSNDFGRSRSSFSLICILALAMKCMQIHWLTATMPRPALLLLVLLLQPKKQTLRSLVSLSVHYLLLLNL